MYHSDGHGWFLKPPKLDRVKSYQKPYIRQGRDHAVLNHYWHYHTVFSEVFPYSPLMPDVKERT